MRIWKNGYCDWRRKDGVPVVVFEVSDSIGKFMDFSLSAPILRRALAKLERIDHANRRDG